MRTSSAKASDSVDVDVADSTTMSDDDDGWYRTNNETINFKIVEHNDDENVPFIFSRLPFECSGCVVTHAILIVSVCVCTIDNKIFLHPVN